VTWKGPRKNGMYVIERLHERERGPISDSTPGNENLAKIMKIFRKFSGKHQNLPFFNE
jgi:hypothetical protein